jgi:4-hydroxy-3-polyprenylbenzoate decarboxylase
MSMQDLRGFLDLLADSGELCRIKVEVDPVLEIAAITERVSKQVAGKALLFEKVKGHQLPVLTNMFGSYRRVGWALWTDHLDALAHRIARDLEKTPGGTAEERLKQLVEMPAFLPHLVRQAPCQEIVETQEADLGIIPALQSWPGDGGRYLTLPMVFSREPATGPANCGMYRVQLVDAKTAAIHWGERSDGARHFRAWQARGKPMPVAIAIGGDPVLTYAAGVPLPGGIDEVSFAGYLRQMPVAMARCITCDLEVPASSEIVIEGLVDPAATCTEGPFGNHTGYYVEAAPAPMIHVTAITRRRDALYPCTVVGRSPMEDCYLAKATERLFLPLLQLDFPAIREINFPLEGIFHGCALISLTEQSAGQGRLLISQLWRQGFLKQSRLLVVFDADVDVQNPSEAYWRAINRVQADRDILIDGVKVGIDVTGHLDRKLVETDLETRQLLERRWSEYRIE